MLWVRLNCVNIIGQNHVTSPVTKATVKWNVALNFIPRVCNVKRWDFFHTFSIVWLRYWDKCYVSWVRLLQATEHSAAAAEATDENNEHRDITVTDSVAETAEDDQQSVWLAICNLLFIILGLNALHRMCGEVDDVAFKNSVEDDFLFVFCVTCLKLWC